MLSRRKKIGIVLLSISAALVAVPYLAYHIYVLTLSNEPFKDCRDRVCLRVCKFQQQDGVDGRLYLKNIRGERYDTDDESFGDCPIYTFKPGNHTIDLEFVLHPNDYATITQSVNFDFNRNTFLDFSARKSSGRIQFYFREFKPPSQREKFEGEFAGIDILDLYYHLQHGDRDASVLKQAACRSPAIVTGSKSRIHMPRITCTGHK